MSSIETSEIEAVKKMVEGMLEEQGKQIQELQQRMEEDSMHSKDRDHQHTKERETWKIQEKLFQKKIRELEKELAHLIDITHHEGGKENLVGKMKKDADEKQRLITSLMNSLSQERSKTKDLEKKLLQQQQQPQHSARSREGKSPTKEHNKKQPSHSSEDRKEQFTVEASTSTDSNIELETECFKQSEYEELDELNLELLMNQLDFEAVSTVDLGEYLRVEYSECSHCRRILTDRVIVHCQHQYCFNCFQILDELKGEDKLICASCKEIFLKPAGVEKLVQMNWLEIPIVTKQLVRKLAMKKTPCEMCPVNETLDSEFYCIHCNEKLCSRCLLKHCERQHTKTPIHFILSIERPVIHHRLLDLEDGICRDHLEKNTDLFCATCLLSICTKCFQGHKGHDVSDISHYANGIKTKIKKGISDIDHEISVLARTSKRCKVLQESNVHRMERVADEIAVNTLKMKLIIDNHARALQRELHFLVIFNSNDLKMMQSDMEECLQELKSFKLYAEEFLEEGEPNYLAYFGRDILDRVEELESYGKDKRVDFENIGMSKGCLVREPLAISFVPVEQKMMQKKIRNLVGTIETKSVKGWTVTLSKLNCIIQSKSAETNEEVSGLAILNDELFVATTGNSTIDVFALENFLLKRKMHGMMNVSNIASCTQKSCLYIYGSRNEMKGISAVDLNCDIVQMWPMEYDAGRLSVTDDCNVVVTECNSNRLSEYTSSGFLILEVTLEPETGVLHLWHALKLPCGMFVVSHGIASDVKHGVCVIDTCGSLLRSYEGDRQTLDTPIYLAFGQRGTIMVADLNNSRVLLLNSVLELKQEIISKKDGLKWPCNIHFDAPSGRLFVASSTFLEQWEVMVFDTE